MGTSRHRSGSPLYTRGALKWRGDGQLLGQCFRALKCDTLNEAPADAQSDSRGLGGSMEPQEYKELTPHLAAIPWKNLQVIAEQNPTLTLLQRALEQDRAIQQMNLQGLRDCCDRLEARYAAANSRDA